MLRQLVTDVAQVSPDDTIPMLAYRKMLADWTGKAGDPAAAAAQFKDLAGRSARRRGNDDQYTTALLQRLAYWKAQAGTTKKPAQHS